MEEKYMIPYNVKEESYQKSVVKPSLQPRGYKT